MCFVNRLMARLIREIVATIQILLWLTAAVLGDGLWSNRHIPAALCEEDAALSEYWTNGVATLHQADARAMPLPDRSVHMVRNQSPPYWGLRDYGLGQWQGGDAECGHEFETPAHRRNDGFRDAKYLANSTFAWPVERRLRPLAGR